ncbi:hypothetical protein HS041_02620 [Planomonospora sp. ID67723]|uniref:histidine kinase n=1 Tax=Planomonospora sp. ID67723 TaxID=2738134 RepID=UPI0018C39E01|nr:histidine kinase [Planomonospora sp. ID67723]MBG0826668.1 hypothetical protein [Planomonospora sp. ID67723]
MDEQAVRLAQRVAVVVSAGFAFGGVIGIVYAEDGPAREVLAFAMLAALFGLHLRNCVRRADGRRPRGWPWTLAAQVVLTAAGLAWFAGTWYGNTGFLAAAVLLLIRRPWARWGGFALVLAAQFLSALTVRPTVGEALYLVVGQAAFVGVALYGVVRLADLITDLRGTQAALAAAAVAGERLAFAEQLNQRIGAGLERVVRHGEAVLEAPGSGRARQELEEGLATARTALSEVRWVSHAHRESAVTASAARAVAGDLTTRTVAVLVTATAVLMIVPREVRHVLRLQLPAGQVALFASALTAFVLLLLYACLGGGRGRLRTLAALAALTYVPAAVLGPELWYVATFLAGAVIVLLRGPLRWIAAAGVTSGDAAFHLLVSGHAGNLLDVVYGVVYTAERAIIVYALWRMAGLTAELRAARAELARAGVARERLRFARDLHDLLGYGLSVVVLKAELAFRLLGRDAEAAGRELSEGLDAARRVLADIGSVASGYSEISLATETASARAVLRAAGVEVTGTVTDAALPGPVDTALAAVLREGVTNMLRHSDARRCTLEVTADDRGVRLRLANDGATAAPSRAAGDGAPGHRSGAGIGNLTDRLGELGGRLRIEATGDDYALVAEAPLQPALVGGDADRVDPVPGVELRDR